LATILITGAGTGLGNSLAKQYAKMGHSIILAGRRKEPLRAAKETIDQIGGNSILFPCDISNYDDLEKKLAELQKLTKIDWLINNAGIGHFGEFETISKNDIDEMLQINLMGTVYITKLLLPMIKKSQEGRIYNIISTAGLRGKVNEAVYCASKFGLRGFTEALQQEYKGTNIKITGVYMGGMDTPFWTHSNHITDKSRLKSADEVAKKISELDDGRAEIII